jgi:hypothetical protein
LTVLEINDALKGRQVLERVDGLIKNVERLQPLTTYLAEAQANLPDDHTWTQLAAETQQQLVNQLRLAAQGQEATTVQALSRDLQALKQAYIEIYAEAHRQSVLTADQDNQRRQMMTGPRWQALKALVDIDLLAANKPEMDGWVKAITSLRVCRDFHEGLLADSPTCTCRFRPREAGDRNAVTVLATLDERLTNLVLRWQQALRAGLNSESAQASLQALSASEKRPILQFLEQKDDDPAIPKGLAMTANQVLRGIQALPLSAEALLDALKEGGMPCTVNDLKQRFNQFISETMRGYDSNSTRLTLKED